MQKKQKQYGGIDASELKRLKKREVENATFKRMSAKQALEDEAIMSFVYFSL
jgi:hypothetical protein